MFIIAFTSARHLPLLKARWIQPLSPLPASWRPILIFSSHLCMDLPSGLIPSGFPTKNPVHTSPLPIRATCPAHLILIDLLTRTILGEQYKLLSRLLCSFLHSPVTSSLLGPNIHLSTLFSNNLSLIEGSREIAFLGPLRNVWNQQSCYLANIPEEPNLQSECWIHCFDIQVGWISIAPSSGWFRPSSDWRPQWRSTQLPSSCFPSFRLQTHHWEYKTRLVKDTPEGSHKIDGVQTVTSSRLSKRSQDTVTASVFRDQY